MTPEQQMARVKRSLERTKRRFQRQSVLLETVEMPGLRKAIATGLSPAAMKRPGGTNLRVLKLRAKELATKERENARIIQLIAHMDSAIRNVQAGAQSIQMQRAMRDVGRSLRAVNSVISPKVMARLMQDYDIQADMAQDKLEATQEAFEEHDPLEQGEEEEGATSIDDRTTAILSEFITVAEEEAATIKSQGLEFPSPPSSKTAIPRHTTSLEARLKNLRGKDEE